MSLKLVVILYQKYRRNPVICRLEYSDHRIMNYHMAFLMVVFDETFHQVVVKNGASFKHQYYRTKPYPEHPLW